VSAGWRNAGAGLRTRPPHAFPGGAAVFAALLPHAIASLPAQSEAVVGARARPCGHAARAGKGCVFSFDPVGSYEREVFRAGGSASSLLQPLLDNQFGFKNQQNHDGVPLTKDQTVGLVKDIFTSAAERDIYTGPPAWLFEDSLLRPVCAGVHARGFCAYAVAYSCAVSQTARPGG